jgi:hypothetical protein
MEVIRNTPDYKNTEPPVGEIGVPKLNIVKHGVNTPRAVYVLMDKGPLVRILEAT